MIEKVKKLAWLLFAPIAFMLWAIDYYLPFFSFFLTFYFTKSILIVGKI